MDFAFSKHAEEQMLRRGINRQTVEAVVVSPDQIVAAGDLYVYQSLIREDGSVFLLRVFVNIHRQPKVIVTLYKTTKISKYYESEI
jgi:hypothetical protein